MGAVFLVEQIAVGNRPVALKVLSRKLLDDPDFLQRFQNEAASTGRIHHPNVVTIYESGQADDGTPYIAMEFLEGESLRQALARRGALPVPEVAEILQQAARGLNAAHKLGIIHRDLKPDNIFLTYPDDDSVAPVSPPANVQVKIVDFGIAKLRESGAHTQTGMVLGTPAYMSYEQASGMRSDELDARSDVYSLGVVVYEMLTEQVPFQSDTPVGYLRKHLQDVPPPFNSVAPGLEVDPAVESAVMKALAKDRDQRYASARDFARELVSAAQPSPRTETPVTIAPTPIVPSSALREPDEPMPLAETARAKADIPAQSTPPDSAERLAAAQRFANRVSQWLAMHPGRAIVETPRAQPQGGNPVVEASAPPGQPRPDSKVVTKVNPRDGLKYVWIPPGTFIMGCSPGDTECKDDEKPPH
jgi:serine/threonine-protein kinase